MKIKLNGTQKFCLVMLLLMFILTSPFMFARYDEDVGEYYKGTRHFIVTGTVGLEDFIPYLFLYAIFIISVLVFSAEEFWEGKNGKMERKK